MRIGISDIGLYVPAGMLTLDTLKNERVKEDEKLERSYRRAIESTGQTKIRFPRLNEDAVTMGAEAAEKILVNKNEGVIRFVAAGTETTVDQSKALSAYIAGALSRAGHAVDENHANFQVQHACAAGALAMISAGGLLQLANRPEQQALIISSDIARYETHSTAEITQGSGAAAVLLESNPSLLELDLATLGFNSRDVDDFFRPNGSITAKVKGRFSVQCYDYALSEAFKDYCRQAGRDSKEVLRETDMFVLHTPFVSMPLTSMRRMVADVLEMTKSEAEEILREKGFHDAIEPLGQIGNTYTASIFFKLAFHLYTTYQKIGTDIEGKTILMFSYGSGNTMAVIPATVAKGASEVIKKWDLEGLLQASESSFEQYEDWVKRPYIPEPADLEKTDVSASGYYLKSIREDGYREYEKR